MICPACNTNNNPNEEYCINCGLKLNKYWVHSGSRPEFVDENENKKPKRWYDG